MTAHNIVLKTFCFLYSIICIATEIWYLVALHKIGDYNDHKVNVTTSFITYTDFFYFTCNILIMCVCVLPREFNNNKELFYGFLGIAIFSATYSLIAGSRLISCLYFNLGEIPFNCKYNYDLPENVKIAYWFVL
ncbi:hypothetical protein GLOIN_2v618243 [Rhizophagus clarus]|uniref:Uncharacterized protein n=1 Tax=Rhizophagus clarus TaxID=94130 RepID=A0A8H3QLM7_9GLOM|nr:hypothetical protein GLOIN_2v618243 [Rhizophagus clarus]